MNKRARYHFSLLHTKSTRALLIGLWLITFVACQPTNRKKDIPQKELDSPLVKVFTTPLASINIIDRNQMSETINSKDRLKIYENVDFLSSQPYQKVMRVWTKDAAGVTHSIITSYHSNGQIRQYLEVENGRAHGRYVEWYANGHKKLQTTIIGGSADLDDKSQSTWSFDGKSKAWNEDGYLEAEITYSKGLLDGNAKYYFSNGALAQETPYSKGLIDGVVHIYDEHGQILEKTTYIAGVRSGPSEGWWEDASCSWLETWKNGHLIQGKYYTRNKELVCTIVDGNGTRCVFDEKGPKELQEYQNGTIEGKVQVLAHNKYVLSSYSIHNGMKHGEEVRNWPPKGELGEQQQTLIPKLSITWYEDKIQGIVKTWYENGVLESSREMSQNMKQGMFMAWYKDGTLMLIEEYDRDKLKRGEYLKKGNKSPVSRINNGKGVATFFDKEGNFLRKVTYLEGKPLDDDDTMPRMKQ